MVQNIQTESKKLREIEEQLERENQDLKAEKLTWGVQRKNLEERFESHHLPDFVWSDGSSI